MKTLDQIKRYISQCHFSDEDWQLILDYCRDRFKGGHIHRAKSPKCESTFKQFIKWIEEGFGSGDIACYGDCVGVIGGSTPAFTFFAAYLGFDGKLIVRDMEVKETFRLMAASDDKRTDFLKAMHDKKLQYSKSLHIIEKLYTPKKYLCVAVDTDYGETADVGIYLESEGSRHQFMAILQNDELQQDVWMDYGYAPLKPAGDKDCSRFYKALSRAGLTYNARFNKIVKATPRQDNNVYYFLNDRFEVELARDSGSKKHELRFKANNYFIDMQEALLFMQEVHKLRGEDL